MSYRSDISVASPSAGWSTFANVTTQLRDVNMTFSLLLGVIGLFMNLTTLIGTVSLL